MTASTKTAFAVYKVVPADAYGAPAYFDMVAGPYTTLSKAAVALAGNRSRDTEGTYYRYPVKFTEPTTSHTNKWNIDGRAF